MVDGGRNLRKGGDDVTSTLVVIDNNDEIPLAIVSYPFRKLKYVDLIGDVYWLPNNFEEMREYQSHGISYFKMKPRELRRDIKELRVLERCDVSRDDPMRVRLDELREMTDGKVMRFVGSLSKMLMTLVIGTSDVFISKKAIKAPFHDYAAAKKIIVDLNGKFTDLEGKEPNVGEDINGILAASSNENYNLFKNFLYS